MFNCVIFYAYISASKQCIFVISIASHNAQDQRRETDPCNNQLPCSRPLDLDVRQRATHGFSQPCKAYEIRYAPYS